MQVPKHSCHLMRLGPQVQIHFHLYRCSVWAVSSTRRSNGKHLLHCLNSFASTSYIIINNRHNRQRSDDCANLIHPLKSLKGLFLKRRGSYMVSVWTNMDKLNDAETIRNLKSVWINLTALPTAMLWLQIDFFQLCETVQTSYSLLFYGMLHMVLTRHAFFTFLSHNINDSSPPDQDGQPMRASEEEWGVSA